MPKNAKLPAPRHSAPARPRRILPLGQEKVLADDREHRVLTAFRRQYYGGRSILADSARQGYVAIVIDMFYWGERRLQYAADPADLRDRSLDLTRADIDAFNPRSSQCESLVARSLFTAGISWPGVMLWDDLRTPDYLASRPEVDPHRLGCVGLSVGGYRSFIPGALAPRIKAAVDVCWMTSSAKQIRRHVINTDGLTFHIPGLFRDFDFPNLSRGFGSGSRLSRLRDRVRPIRCEIPDRLPDPRGP